MGSFCSIFYIVAGCAVENEVCQFFPEDGIGIELFRDFIVVGDHFAAQLRVGQDFFGFTDRFIGNIPVNLSLLKKVRLIIPSVVLKFANVPMTFW